MKLKVILIYRAIIILKIKGEFNNIILHFII